MYKLLIVLVICFIALNGCSNAGPYVTDVSFDGEGNLLVTKNVVTYNMFLGVVSNGDNPQTILIKTPK